MDVLADKGYTTGQQIHECTDNKITTYCSPKESTKQKNDLFPISRFTYDPTADTYTCPNNAVLSGTGNVYHKNNNVKVKHYKNFKACSVCPLSRKCTTSKKGRLIERSIYQEDLEENAERVNQNPEYYRERQQVTVYSSRSRSSDTRVWHPKAPLGIYLHPDEDQDTRAHRGQFNDDLLQP